MLAASYLLFTLLFLLPFLAIPNIPFGFEQPKVFAAQLLIIFIIAIIVFKQGLKPFYQINKLSLILISALIILSIVQLFLFQSWDQLFGNVFRLQGIFLLWYLILFALCSKQIKLPSLPSYIYFLLLTALMLSTLSLGTNSAARFIGTLGEPNALGATAIFFLPFVIFNQPKKIILLGALAAFLIVLLSGSRSSLIAFILEISFILLVFKTKLPLLFSIIFITLLMILSLTLPFFENNGWYESRAEIWQVSLEAGLSQPFLGWGFGNTQKAISDTANLLGSNVKFSVVDSSHNFLLDYFIQAGILGLVIILALVILSFKFFYQQKDYLKLTLLFGILTVMLFNPVSIVTLICFWWLIGQGTAKV